MKIKILRILILLLFGCAASAQDVTLYQQFNGRYDFTFTGNTLNMAENNTSSLCDILTSSSATLTLDPSDEVIAAYLYWAGSGSGDAHVSLNGQEVHSSRDFLATRTALEQVNGEIIQVSRDYFSAFADITAQVDATGSGSYTLSDLDLTDLINDSNDLYCRNATNFGGWAIIVIYKNDSLPLNQINLYDGYEFVPDAINITLPSLNVIDNVGAKIGFLAWEGDVQLATENLTINGNVLSNPPLNPANNAFNGTNSTTGMSGLFNMDLDIYNIQNNIQIGDESAEIALTSFQDLVLVNAIVTKLNSQLPDATISVENVLQQCNTGTITVEYTVYNENSTEVLPAGTPIAFYVEGTYIGGGFTNGDIAIGGSESGSVTLGTPANTPYNYELLVVVDDQGNGVGIVTETDETNNFSLTDQILYASPQLPPIADVHACETPTTLGIFDFSSYETDLLLDPTNTISFHLSEADAQVPQDEITNLSAFEATQNPQQIFVRVQNTDGCVTIGSFFLITDDCLLPDGVVEILSIEKNCDSRLITIDYIVSNPDSFDILPAGTTVTVYVNGTLLTTLFTQQDMPVNGSEAGTVTLNLPTWVPVDFELTLVVDHNNMVDEDDETNNSDIQTDTLWVTPVLQWPPDLTVCETENNSGVGVFDFSEYATSLQTGPNDVVTFYESLDNANNEIDPIDNPENYLSNSSQQIIYIRLEGLGNCYTIGQFKLIAVDCLFPDATVSFGDIITTCDSRFITVNYTVNNFDSQDILPAGTPVSIYANGIFIDYTETLMDIAIGGSEAGTITLEISNDIPLDFELTFVADDTGNGTGIVVETDETNNATSANVTLPLSPVPGQAQNLTSCDIGYGLGVFDLTENESLIRALDDEEVYFYLSLADANQDANRIYDVTEYNSTANPQEIFVRVDNETCYSTTSFMIGTEKCPPTTYNYVTPNGDGYNDSFFVEGLRNIFFNFKISIYNRWGNLVWTGNHNTEDWNGVANVDKVGPDGNTVPVGTYYFVLELNDPAYPEPIVGWVYVTK